MAERIPMARHPMKLGEEERKVEEEDERARKDSRFWITVGISVLASTHPPRHVVSSLMT